jgi:hypothetical protein
MDMLNGPEEPMSQGQHSGRRVVPRGQGIRRALRWMSDEGRHDLSAVEEACRRFDLSPAEEEFLLSEARRLRGPARS